MTVHTAITAEQLLAMGDVGRCELIRRYAGEQELRDEPTLPGFVLKLSDLFDPES